MVPVEFYEFIGRLADIKYKVPQAYATNNGMILA
jgi:hypothetical protein